MTNKNQQKNPQKPAEENKEQVVKPKPMSSMQKVQYMYSLTEIAEDEQVKNAIKAKKNGDLAYDLFINAVSEKIDEIMNQDRTSEEKKNSESLSDMVRQLQTAVANFQGVAGNSQLMLVLQQLNQKLGGEQATQTQPPPRQQRPQQYPQRKPQFNQQYDESPHYEEPEQTGGGTPGGSQMTTTFIT